MYKNYFKRLLDLILSIGLIIVLMPLMILIFFIIWIFIGFPIFTQLRPGLNNKLFKIYKFKTLYDQGFDRLERQSKIGNFLRQYGLDELPQLFNIIKNDMSFIGPRPLLAEYLGKYSKEEIKRHNIKPGITGLSQVTSLKKNSWSIRLKLDLIYVKKISFYLDLKIFIKTFVIVIQRKKMYKNYQKLHE